MNIVITGASGFVGTELCKTLKEKGHTILDTYSLDTKKISEFSLNSDADAVVHLAAKANVRLSIKEPEPYWDINVKQSKEIFKQCYDNNVRCIYASSSSAAHWYLSPYGTTKRVMEEIAYPGQIGLRFTTVFGEHPRKGMLWDYILNGTVQYATTHKRDFIYVKDVVNAILLLLEKESLENVPPVLNVSSNQAIDIPELLKYADYDVPLNPGDDCEAQTNVSDNIELCKLGWSPTKNVYQFINEQRNRIKDNKLKEVERIKQLESKGT